MGLTGSFVNVAGRLAGVQQVVALAAGVLMVLLGARRRGPLDRPQAARGARVRQGGRRSCAGCSRAGDRGGSTRPASCWACCRAALSWTVFLGAAGTGSLPEGLLIALAFGVGTFRRCSSWVRSASAVGLPRAGRSYRTGGVLVALLGVLFVLRGAGVLR